MLCWTHCKICGYVSPFTPVSDGSSSQPLLVICSPHTHTRAYTAVVFVSHTHTHTRKNLHRRTQTTSLFSPLLHPILPTPTSTHLSIPAIPSAQQHSIQLNRTYPSHCGIVCCRQMPVWLSFLPTLISWSCIETWRLSFAKFLEISFYRGDVICKSDLCQHSVLQDHVRYFYYKDKVYYFIIK